MERAPKEKIEKWRKIRFYCDGMETTLFLSQPLHAGVFEEPTNTIFFLSFSFYLWINY